MSITFARLSVLILAALAVAFLAACGDDDDTADEPTPTASLIDGGPTSPARASIDFEGACSLVSVSEIALVLAVDPDDLVIGIDDQNTTCTFSGESTFTIVLEERESAEVAAAEVADAGVGADPLSIGDGAYLVGDSVISSRDVYVITFTLDPPDDETLVGLARRAAVRVPTPTATPE